MDSNAITAEVVRDTLNAIRAAEPLDDDPLIALDALGPALAAARTDDTPEARRRLLPRWLEEVTATHLARVRGEGQPAGPAHVAAEEALERLADDFASESREREVWATLHFRFFSGSQVSLLQLADTLGVSRRTLRRRITSGYAALAEMLRDLEREAEVGLRRGHNVPAARTRFIGREAELAAIRRLLAAHRSVTLKGPGGVGKSRLAARLARDLGPDYADGVWFVELTAVGEDRQVPGAVLAALGVQEQPGRALTATLAEHLAERRALLVLDNCEHVVHGSGELVRALLARSASLQVLATSRAELALEDGAVYEVPPLALPPEGERERPERALHYDAVRLFGSRAMAAARSFRMDDENAGQVTRLCVRLDGIPLAIELAAMRTRHLSLEELEGRLADRFALLQDGRHALRPGHETLQAALEVSYELLGPAEQALLCRLSVFRGGWTLEAAQAVCSGDGVEPSDVGTLLDGLEAQSLVSATRRDDGAARFSMLETVRQYGRARLETDGVVGTWRDRHLDYYLALADDGRADGPLVEDWLAQMHREDANLHAALGWARQAGDPALALRLAGRLGDYWYKRGRLETGVEQLEQALSLPGGEGYPSARAAALRALGALLIWRSDAEGAREALEEAVATFRELGDGRNLARSLLDLGNYKLYFAEHLDGAHRCYSEALAVARAIGDTWHRAIIEGNLGMLEAYRGDATAAAPLLARTADRARELGNNYRLAVTQLNLAVVARMRGEYKAAEQAAAEALAYARSRDQPLLIGDALKVLGQVAIERGAAVEAVPLLEESVSVLRDVDPYNAAASLYELGRAAYELGDRELREKAWREGTALDRELDLDHEIPFEGIAQAIVALEREKLDTARALVLDTLRAAHARGQNHEVAQALEALGWCAVAGGDARAAVRLLAAAGALMEQLGLVLGVPDARRRERAMARARSALSDGQFAHERDCGAQMGPDEAVDFALDYAAAGDTSGA